MHFLEISKVKVVIVKNISTIIECLPNGFMVITITPKKYYRYIWDVSLFFLVLILGEGAKYQQSDLCLNSRGIFTTVRLILECQCLPSL